MIGVKEVKSEDEGMGNMLYSCVSNKLRKAAAR